MEIATYVGALVIFAALIYGAVMHHRRTLSRHTTASHRADQMVRDRYEHHHRRSGDGETSA